MEDMVERKIRETIQFRGNVYGGVLFGGLNFYKIIYIGFEIFRFFVT